MNVEEHPCYERARTYGWKPVLIFKDHLIAKDNKEIGNPSWVALYSPDPTRGFLGHLFRNNEWQAGYFPRSDEAVLRALFQLYR